MATLYYFHDPMCSWCWAFRPQWLALRQKLPSNVEPVSILAGLAPDSNESVKPEVAASMEQTWRRIEAMFGCSFNYQFWQLCQPKRSTYIACRAVIAAAVQGQEEAMIEAIQSAYYQQAKNPSELATLCDCAETIGLDVGLFRTHMNDSYLQELLWQEIDFFQRYGGGTGMPALALEHHHSIYPIQLDYRESMPMLTQIEIVLEHVTQEAAHGCRK